MSKPDWKECERVVAGIKEFCVNHKVTVLIPVQSRPKCRPSPWQPWRISDHLIYADPLYILK